MSAEAARKARMLARTFDVAAELIESGGDADGLAASAVDRLYALVHGSTGTDAAMRARIVCVIERAAEESGAVDELADRVCGVVGLMYPRVGAELSRHRALLLSCIHACADSAGRGGLGHGKWAPLVELVNAVGRELGWAPVNRHALRLGSDPTSAALNKWTAVLTVVLDEVEREDLLRRQT